MPDEKTDKTRADCVPCTIAWNIFVCLGVLTVAFLAWDTLSDGGASEWLGGLIQKARPALAIVRPISDEGEQDAG